MLVDVSFFPTRNLRDPSADQRETLPHDLKLVLFYNPTSKIRGALPQKIWGQKHAKFGEGKKIVQNFSRFLTTFDFDREYLRNVFTYRKSEK